MDIKIANEIQATSWEHLPDTTTLLEYLDRKCLIELSKCCKRYRNQLERHVFENFNLSFMNFKIFNQYDLNDSEKCEKVPELLESNLGEKIKFVKHVTLAVNLNRTCPENLIKLLTNIKSLTINLHGNEYLNIGLFLKTFLKDMNHLERVRIPGVYERINGYSTEMQIFPKSVKSLEIENNCPGLYNNLFVYDTIDASYTNLIYLTISSNTMLQNLSTGMPNLQEVDIDLIHELDASKIVLFLKANPQLKKLERWKITSSSRDPIEVNDLPSNYSIKQLVFRFRAPAPLTLQIINSCNSLETLDLRNVHNLMYDMNIHYLEWSKFKRSINILKLNNGPKVYDEIKIIDNLKLFKQLHYYYIRPGPAAKQFDEYFSDKLINYRTVPYNPQSLIRKLIYK